MLHLKRSAAEIGQSDDYGLDEYRRDMADMRALIKIPPVISTKTFQEMGSQANKRPKVEVPLPQIVDASWESPTWAQVTNFNDQLPEADKGQKKELGCLFAQLLQTAPVNTPFVFHDVHTKPSVCGSALKPDFVMGLRDKPCNTLTTGAIINFRPQGGDYDNDENVGKAILCGRVFLQQLPRSLRSTVLIVAKVPFGRDLSQECAILQSLQGIAGIPNLLRSQCVCDSILMRPVLAPLTAGALHEHNLHNSLPAVVQTLKASHGKGIVNRDVTPRNLMHTMSDIYLVYWGSAALQQMAPYEGTVHSASVSVLQQLTQGLDCVKVIPADDLESLVVSFFCVRHPDAHTQLQNVDRLQVPVAVLQWWRQIWMACPQWQLALKAARAANYNTLADRLQTLLE